MVRSILGGVDNDRLHILRTNADDHGSLFGVAKTQMLLQGEIMKDKLTVIALVLFIVALVKFLNLLPLLLAVASTQ